MGDKQLKISLKEIARLVCGEIEGDPSVIITGVAPIETAQKGDISFIVNSRYEKYLNTTEASALLVPTDSTFKGKNLLRVNNPQLAFLKILETFFHTNSALKAGIHSTALLSENVKIGADVAIGPYVVIGENVIIGDHVTIHPGVIIESEVEIGDYSVLHARVFVGHGTRIGRRVNIFMGTVIGSDGFGFVKENGQYRKMPHIGNVIIEDDVEIGANCTIDRATMGFTRIGKGTKLDNMVHVAHNVEIGEHTVIAAQAAIAGSTKIGKHVIVGGQVGFADHIEVGDYVVLAARTGVTKSIPPHTVVSGFPAAPHAKVKKREAALRHLPDMMKKLRQLEKQIREILFTNSKKSEE